VVLSTALNGSMISKSCTEEGVKGSSRALICSKLKQHSLFVSNIKTQNSWSWSRDFNSNLPIQSRNTKHATAISRISDVWFSEKCPLSNFAHVAGPKNRFVHAAFSSPERPNKAKVRE